jgi:hypothetical protein
MALPWSIGSVAQRLYDELAPVSDTDAANGWGLLTYVDALGQMFQHVADIVETDDVMGWGALLDINQVPDEGLTWFAQFVGVDLNPAYTKAQQRQQIRDRQRWARGTPGAIQEVVKPFLTGTKTVVIVERSPDPWQFVVSSYATETPADTTYQTLWTNYLTYTAYYNAFFAYEQYWATIPSVQVMRAITSQKPAGDLFTYTILAGSPGSPANTYTTVWIRYLTYQELWNADQTYLDVYNEN